MVSYSSIALKKLSIDILKQLHDPKYVDAFDTGFPEKLATFQGFKPWNIQLRDAVYQINAGQVLAAELAWNITPANIAQGFHHAVYEHGGSFVPLTGWLWSHNSFQINVFSCWTVINMAVMVRQNLPGCFDNFFNYSIYGLAFGCPTYERSETCIMYTNIKETSANTF